VYREFALHPRVFRWGAISGGAGDWLDAVIEPDAKRVRTGGDRRLTAPLDGCLDENTPPIPRQPQDRATLVDVASSQATDERNGGGYRARAGALTLLYLSSPLERPVLRTLMAELTTGVKMQEIGPPDPEFMAMGIFEDPYLLEPADPDHPPGEPIGPDTLLRPTPAGREVPFVGAVLAGWLRRCPQGPLEHGPESGRHMAALLGGWASMTIHALAGGPRSAAQVCEAIQVIDRGAVDARIDSMLETRLLAGGRAG